MLQHTELTPPAAEFTAAFSSLPEKDQINLFAILLEHMENRQINRKNSTEYADSTAPDNDVLTPDLIGLDNGVTIASDILAGVNGPYPLPTPEELAEKPTQAPPLLDVAEGFAERNEDIDRVNGHFYSLDYPDKLLALAELFCMAASGALPIHTGHIPNGYETARRLLELRRTYMDGSDDFFPA